MVQNTVNVHPGRHYQSALSTPHASRLNFLYGIFVFDVFKALLLRCNFKNERRPEMREVLVEEGVVFGLGQFVLVWQMRDDLFDSFQSCKTRRISGSKFVCVYHGRKASATFEELFSQIPTLLDMLASATLQENIQGCCCCFPRRFVKQKTHHLLRMNEIKLRVGSNRDDRNIGNILAIKSNDCSSHLSDEEDTCVSF